MWSALKEFFTSNGGQWHETLPFAVGLLFVFIEILVRAARGRQPVFSVPALAYMLSEGIAVTIVLIYGLALAFDKGLALVIADKNGKVLAVAMLVAFGTLVAHILNRWFSDTPESH